MSAIFQRALRFTHVGIADGGAYVVQRHALIKQRLRIQPDAYGGQRAAANIDITDTVDLRNRRSQLRRGEIVQFTLRISIGCQREDHNWRIRRVRFAISRAAGHPTGQQTLCGVDRRLHITRRTVDIPVKIKLQNNTRAAERTAGGHFTDSGNAPK